MDHKKFAIYEFCLEYKPLKIPSIKYLKLETSSQAGMGAKRRGWKLLVLYRKIYSCSKNSANCWTQQQFFKITQNLFCNLGKVSNEHTIGENVIKFINQKKE